MWLKRYCARLVLFSAVIIHIATVSAQQSPPTLEAYACDHCSLEQAENIARLHAPINACSIWQNGTTASFCEPVSKQVLILSQATEEVFKFNVVTQINSQNAPFVNVWSFPITQLEISLSNEYFNFYTQLKNAVSTAQSALTLSQANKPTSNTSLEYSFTSSSSPASCESHPTHYFKSVGNERDIKNQLVSEVNNRMANTTWAEFTHETFVGGGSVNIASNGAGLGVDLRHIQNRLAITKEYGPGNYLSFEIFALSDVGDPSNVVLDLRLNKNFSQIDGISLATLFSDEVDLTDTAMSNCWRDYVDEEGEVTPPEQGAGGGSGTLDDPYTGGGGHFAEGTFCVISRTVTTCKSDHDGSRTCTTSKISMISACSLYGG